MATTKQTHMIAGRMVEFQEKFSSLSNDDAQYVIQNAGDAIDIFIRAIANRGKSTIQAATPILGGVICTFTVPPTTEKFIARDRFKVDTSRMAKVKISLIGSDFSDWFLGKIEAPFSGSTIQGRELNKNSVDGPILQELGGSEAAETTLAEIWAAMSAQSDGKSENLLNNGWANLFYVKDMNGILRVVNVSKSISGWGVNANSIVDPDDWHADFRVFVRNSGTQAS